MTTLKAETLRALAEKATPGDLHETGRYFAESCNDLTQCGHGDTGEYRNAADGKLIAHLWNNRAALLSLLEADKDERGTNPETAGVEPVAWMYHDEEGIPHLQFGRRPSGFVKRNGWAEMPLYAHPPAACADGAPLLREARNRLERHLDEEYPYLGCRDDLRDIWNAALKGLAK